jgi:hypothetical protein
MGKNDSLIMLIAAGGLIYFYSKNPDFKAKVDGFLAGLKGQAAAATPAADTSATTTVDPNSGNTVLNLSPSGHKFDANTNTFLPDFTYDTEGLNINESKASSKARGTICKNTFGGDCSVECNLNSPDHNAGNCQKCILACGPVNKAQRVKKTKKFRKGGLTKKESANLLQHGSVTGKQPKVTNVPDNSTDPADQVTTDQVQTVPNSVATPGAACHPACASFQKTSPVIYEQCCASNSAFARRYSYLARFPNM